MYRPFILGSEAAYSIAESALSSGVAERMLIEPKSMPDSGFVSGESVIVPIFRRRTESVFGVYAGVDNIESSPTSSSTESMYITKHPTMKASRLARKVLKNFMSVLLLSEIYLHRHAAEIPL